MGGTGMWPDVDRREQSRVDIAVPVQVDGDESIEGTSRDLSTDGMRVELDQRLPVAADVTVTFELPNTGFSVSVSAEVRWRKQVGPKSASQWVVGVSFSAFDGADRERLARFLDEKRSGYQ